MKKNKIALTLFIYFFGNTFFSEIINNHLNKSSIVISTIALLLAQIFLIIPLYIINKNELFEMLKDFKKNYKRYLKIGFIIWLIGFIIMTSMTYLINYVVASEITLSTNEQTVRETVENYFIYSLIAHCFIIPIVEELTFRQGFNQIKNPLVFLIITSSLFAFLHIAGDFKNPIKLLYFFPYTTMALMFAIAYTKTNNFFVSLIVHSWHNSFNFILMFIL